MPKINFIFPRGRFASDELSIAGESIRPLVAKAASTKERHLTAEDIDWLPQPYDDHNLASMSMEIETIGYEDRIKKLNEKNVRELKRRVVEILAAFTQMNPDAPLIWIKFQNPAGVHV